MKGTESEEMKTSLVAQMVKNPPATQETGGLILGQKDALEKGMDTHSSILAWRIPRTEEPGRLQSMGLRLILHFRAQYSTGFFDLF